MTILQKVQQAKFIKSLNNIYCRLMPCENGIGVFAIRHIPKLTNPFKENYNESFMLIEIDKLTNVDSGILKIIKDFCPLQDKYYIVPKRGLGVIDISFYVNHSLQHNIIINKKNLNFYTIRDIKKGEELTVDYNTYDDLVEEYKNNE